VCGGEARQRTATAPNYIRLPDNLKPGIGVERRWYGDAAVGLLVVLHERDEHTRQGQSRAVQRVDEPRPRTRLVVLSHRLSLAQQGVGFPSAGELDKETMPGYSVRTRRASLGLWYMQSSGS